MPRPSAAAVESDDECFIAVERLDLVQAGCAGDRDGGSERVGEAEVVHWLYAPARSAAVKTAG
jgi:hypothetical protein